MVLLTISASATQLLLATGFPEGSISVQVALHSALRENYPWIFLTPLILWCWLQWPIQWSNLWWRGPLHIALSLGTAVVFAVLVSGQNDRVFVRRVSPPGTDLLTSTRPMETRALNWGE